MSQNEQNVNPEAKSTNPIDNSASTPPAQPAANVPAGVNPGTPDPAQAAAPAPAPKPAEAAPKAEEKAVVPVNSYIPGGLNKDVVNPIPNPAQTDQNFPFSAGHKMHEVAQYQNFFTFPLDTYYNIFDAVYYFSDENNRNRYTYEQQQIIISRIVRAAKDFGIPIEGIRDKLTL
jgi:hypothetical protein